jgi:hypothetical protein
MISPQSTLSLVSSPSFTEQYAEKIGFVTLHSPRKYDHVSHAVVSVKMHRPYWAAIYARN